MTPQRTLDLKLAASSVEVTIGALTMLSALCRGAADSGDETNLRFLLGNHELVKVPGLLADIMETIKVDG